MDYLLTHCDIAHVAMCLWFLDLLGDLDKKRPFFWVGVIGLENIPECVEFGASMRDVISVERALWSQFWGGW